MGGFLGLNYQSIEFSFRIYNEADPQKMFEGLRTMEHEILLALSEKKGV